MSNLRRKSSVWLFFDPVGGDTKFVKCSLCKQEYKHSGNTSNLSDHLKRKHPGKLIESSSSSVSTARLPEGTKSPKRRKSNAGSLKTYMDRSKVYDTNSKEKKELDKLYAQMIVRDYMPFRTSEHVGFKNFIFALNSKYELPDRSVLKTTLIPLQCKDIEEKLIIVLNEIKFCSITTDMWTSVGNEGILAVTSHFVHRGQLKSPLLKVSRIEGRHTSEAMSKVK